MSNLIYKAEPRSNILQLLWSRECSDSIQIFWQRLYFVCTNSKSRKVDCSLTKLQFIGIKDYPMTSYQFQIINHTPPMFLQFRVPQSCIISALCFALNLLDYL